MNFVIKEQIDKRKNALPKEVSDILFSEKKNATIKEIFDKFKLDSYQYGSIRQKIDEVILGLINANDFLTGIIKELGKNTKEVTSIIQEIDRKVFRPLKYDLQALKRNKNISASMHINNKQKTELPTQKSSSVSLPIPPQLKKKPVIMKRAPIVFPHKSGSIMEHPESEIASIAPTPEKKEISTPTHLKPNEKITQQIPSSPAPPVNLPTPENEKQIPGIKIHRSLEEEKGEEKIEAPIITPHVNKQPPKQFTPPLPSQPLKRMETTPKKEIPQKNDTMVFSEKFSPAPLQEKDAAPPPERKNVDPYREPVE